MEKNIRLELLKILACILIVLLHCNFVKTIDSKWDVISILIHCFTRFSVPVFAGISGYFLLLNKSYSMKEIYKKIYRYLFIYFGFLYIVYFNIVY